MSGIVVTTELRGFQEAFFILEKLANGNLYRLADFSGTELKGLTYKAFKDEVDPVTGEKWKKSSSAASGGRSTLYKRGDLFRSVQHEPLADGSVLLGSNKVYARIHQKGGKIEPKNGGYLTFKVGGGFVKVKSVNIPRRRFLGHPDDWVAKLLVMDEVRSLLEPV